MIHVLLEISASTNALGMAHVWARSAGASHATWEHTVTPCVLDTVPVTARVTVKTSGKVTSARCPSAPRTAPGMASATVHYSNASVTLAGEETPVMCQTAPESQTAMNVETVLC